ncbi:MULTISPECIES: hypothetical protein [unclassified Streptomyces]|uniref:hypothetical protein n=1 Tax=unclassified Streptomyces TaxID=2593676 RepID=UPI0037FDA405
MGPLAIGFGARFARIAVDMPLALVFAAALTASGRHEKVGDVLTVRPSSGCAPPRGSPLRAGNRTGNAGEVALRGPTMLL